MEVKFFHLHCTVVHKKSGVIIINTQLKLRLEIEYEYSRGRPRRNLYPMNQIKQNKI